MAYNTNKITNTRTSNQTSKFKNMQHTHTHNTHTKRKIHSKQCNQKKPKTKNHFEKKNTYLSRITVDTLCVCKINKNKTKNKND